MDTPVKYKVGGEVVGPVDFAIVQREIATGSLASDTPIQLLSNGIWSDAELIARKLKTAKRRMNPIYESSVFILLFTGLAIVGVKSPVLLIFSGVLLYLLGTLVNYFQIGRQDPVAATKILIAMLTVVLVPLHIHLFSLEFSRTSSTVRWLVFGAIGNLVLGFLFIHWFL